MILQLTGEVNNDMAGKVINFYNYLPKDETDIEIYLASHGGHVDAANIIVDIISGKHADKTTLIAYEYIGSCAFSIFKEAKVSAKRMLHNCTGMIHQITMPVKVNETGGFASPIEKHWKQSLSIDKLASQQYCADLKLTTLELKKYLAGQDVYFQYPRMLELLELIK